MNKRDCSSLINLAKSLKHESTIVQSMIRDMTSRYALRETVPTMQKAAAILEEIAYRGSMEERVKIITALSDSMEGQINAFIKDSTMFKEDFEMVDLQVHEAKNGNLRAVISYRYRGSTRS